MDRWVKKQYCVCSQTENRKPSEHCSNIISITSLSFNTLLCAVFPMNESRDTAIFYESLLTTNRTSYCTSNFFTLTGRFAFLTLLQNPFTISW